MSGRGVIRSPGLVTLLALALLVAGCGGVDGPGDVEGELLIVATTTVVGDIAANVVGEAGTVEVLLARGADPHDFQLSSRQAALLLEADLVVANGLALEEGLVDVLAAARADGANVLEVAPLVDPLPRSLDGAGDEPEGEDPHFWLDPLRVAEAARLMAAELESTEATGEWATRADAYAADLFDADQEIQTVLAVVPSTDRKLITNHESLGYFADRYGFEIIGTVIPGGATLANPSSEDLAALVRTIEQEGVSAIFAENTNNASLAEAVAAEAGDEVQVVELFTGSLGEQGSGADTLIGMLLTNADRIAAALQ